MNISTILTSAFTKIIILILLFFYVIFFTDFSVYKLALYFQDPSLFIKIIILLSCAIVPLDALRWYVLLKSVKIKISYVRSIKLTWIGNFFNAFIPGGVTGDLVKGSILCNGLKFQKALVASSIVMHRFIGIISLILISLSGLIISFESLRYKLLLSSENNYLFLTILALIILFILMSNGYLFKKVSNISGNRNIKLFFLSFKRFKVGSKVFFFSFFISLIMQIIIVYIFFLITNSISTIEINFIDSITIVPIGFVSLMVPITPSGLGVGHIAYEILYQQVGVNGGSNIFNLYIFAQLIIFLIVGSIFYLLNKGVKKNDRK